MNKLQIFISYSKSKKVKMRYNVYACIEITADGRRWNENEWGICGISFIGYCHLISKYLDSRIQNKLRPQTSSISTCKQRNRATRSAFFRFASTRLGVCQVFQETFRNLLPPPKKRGGPATTGPMCVRWLTHAKTIDLQMILEEVDTSHFTNRSQMSKCHHLADFENMTVYGWVWYGPRKTGSQQRLTSPYFNTCLHQRLYKHTSTIHLQYIIYKHSKHNNCTKVAQKNQ